ncbi:helix-turn-helix domain-containing protein [Thalassomonas haliotis]|uniref:Helix-turn-helix transcriptional regulator n=1 Tax=Thalassomonas haliotis TaxID=485448 RepID=A0ABY7VF38_9GAMM|nr:helix-turn-helix transcriptional regulator [Thalassomonas haliotis]WDE12332.1 helix-turn-helix transcriptional regulator [Thalassomonas haliotis]
MYYRRITGDDLKRMRLSCNYTTEEMAKVAGVKRATYERWERGETEPKMNQSHALQAHCRMDVAPIFTKYDELKEMFTSYKNIYDSDDKPNQVRASKTKKFLNPDLKEQAANDEPETNI